MKATLSYLLVGILLLAAGTVFRRAAAFEEALSSAQEQIATQNPAGALALENAERAARWTASLPVVGSMIERDLRRVRALEAYWRSDYSALETTDGEGERADAGTRFIAANAMFRDVVRQPRESQTLGRGLDAVLKAYLSVLEADPTAADAAYNFEFVSRLRGLLVAGRGNGIGLPQRSNMHGEKGSPPSQTKPSEFNIIVPLRPEERQEQTDPQAGGVLQRKG